MPSRLLPELTPDELHARALRHLDRFDASGEKLRQVLRRTVRRRRLDPLTTARLDQAIEAIVARLAELHVIDDTRFAETLVRGMRERGASARAIAHKLAERGVADGIAAEALAAAGSTDDSELEAACAFVRRRRLGSYRPSAERAAAIRKDLTALARAGYSLDIARRALELHIDDDAF
ncbi:MAG: RecX family transcriptional regulator [Polyangiaceae bacterium]|nr:RecX family transcriptional regulator [Polyangiaceae bacterium]